MRQPDKRPYADLGQQLADSWQPVVTDALGPTAAEESALTNPEFMRQVVQANLDTMVEQQRAELEALLAAIPWPVRMLAKVLARMRR